MAKQYIPVWAPNFVEFTKVEPVLQRVNSTGALTEIGSSGEKAGYSMSKRHATYIDVNQILGVAKFFDEIAQKYRDYRVLTYLVGTLFI